MIRKTILVILSLFCWIGSAVSQTTVLKMDDIHRVMERLFSFHIENKELSPLLVRRTIKLYIEQFDPEKAYFLESEVLDLVNMSEQRVQEILAHLEDRDYR